MSIPTSTNYISNNENPNPNSIDDIYTLLINNEEHFNEDQDIGIKYQMLKNHAL